MGTEPLLPQGGATSGFWGMPCASRAPEQPILPLCTITGCLHPMGSSFPSHKAERCCSGRTPHWQHQGLCMTPSNLLSPGQPCACGIGDSFAPCHPGQQAGGARGTQNTAPSPNQGKAGRAGAAPVGHQPQLGDSGAETRAPQQPPAGNEGLGTLISSRGNAPSWEFGHFPALQDYSLCLGVLRSQPVHTTCCLVSSLAVPDPSPPAELEVRH